MPTLYISVGSGNCYKPELVAAQTRQPLEVVEIDLLAHETRQETFLARNPNGRVPVLTLDDGRHIAESNAIMAYLARGSTLIPDDPYLHAKMLEWLFFEQYSHEPAIAVARFWWTLKPGGRMEKKDRFAEWHEKGHAALSVMDRHLTDHAFFLGAAYSLADIALYAYTHVADEGGFDLAPYPAITAWLDRVRQQPNHIPMRPWPGTAQARD